jgi:pimeloyl-ACP methyl ester carboxylesterase
MKNIILTLSAFACISISAQIVPSSSPYLNDGTYPIVADSNENISPNALWYRPQTPGNYPVFFFQPGANGFFGGSLTRHSYDLFLKHVASWGYVVVVVDETSAGFPNGNGFKTVYDWYMDGYDNGGWQADYTDINKVVVGGHSNGGVNATNLIIDYPNEIHAIVYMASYPSNNFALTHDVSTYTGHVLSMSGSEDTDSEPSDVKTGYEAFDAADCGVYIDFAGMGHGGFGDYDNSAQPVGAIGRADATASIKHYLTSFLNYSLKQDATAEANLLMLSNRLTSENEFESTCVINTSSVTENKVNIDMSVAGDFIILESDVVIESINVYDIQGRVVENIIVNQLLVNLCTNQFNSGTYLVQATLVTGVSKTFKVGLSK